MYSIGDLVRLPNGTIRTIVCIEPCGRRQHRYLGVRLARANWGNKINITRKGLRSLRRVYWIRADLVLPYHNTVVRGGKVGRPKRKHGGARPYRHGPIVS